MDNLRDNYELLISKLDGFIRKYYKNQLIRGLLLTGTALLAAFLLVTVPEYFFYFNRAVRAVLFYGFIILAGAMLILYVLKPLLRYYRLGKTIDHVQAATIIGHHFSDVKDRLLNVLQLKSLADAAHDTDLIEASISQKAQQLKPIPFSNAINLAINRKYIKYLALPAGALLFILLASPDVLRKGTNRLVQYDKTFEREAPFTFTVNPGDLEVLQYQDFPIKVHVDGRSLPNEVFVNMEGYDYKLTRKSATDFEFVFNKVNKDIRFTVSGGGFNSHEYDLKIIPKPAIAQFETQLHYPAYINKKDDAQHNIGDIAVPEGTDIRWIFYTNHTDAISIKTEGALKEAIRKDDGTFTYSLRAKHDEPYSLFVSNKRVQNADSVNYTVTVIPDQYPTIQVNAASDSSNSKLIYFAGEAGDDYGLTKINLHYILTHSGDDAAKPTETNIPVQTGLNNKHSTFSYSWNFNSLSLQPGDKVTYYFEAWDNDGVNGSKATRSQTMNYEMPTVSQFEQKQRQTYSDIKNELSSSTRELKALQDEIEKQYNKVLQKKDLNWEDKKQIEELLKKEEELQKKLADAQKKYDEISKQKEDYKKTDDEMKDKKDQLNNLMKDINNDKMKQIMDKYKDLLQKMNKDNMLNQLKDNKYENQQMEMNADRMLSLFKQMEFEEKLKDAKNKLDNLQQKQDDLGNQTEQKAITKENAEQKQDKLNKEFEDLKKDLKETQDLNNKLDEPTLLPDWETDQKQIEEQMQKSSEQMKDGKMSKGSQSQKKAAEKMKKLSEQMERFMNSISLSGDSEDIRALRQILSNLLKLSFDQEDLAGKTKRTSINSPQYIDLMKDQRKMIDNAQMVEDSIVKLGKKVADIKAYVVEKITALNKSMDNAVEELENRNAGQAAAQQQFAMTYLNDLALIFSELTDKQQKKMQEDEKKKGGSGKGSCNKPGGTGNGKPTLKALQKMQMQLKDKLTPMAGNKPGGEKPGQMPGQKPGGQKPGGQQPGGDGGGTGNGNGNKEGNNNDSKQLAQLAQEQAKIREKLRDMADQLTNGGLNGDMKHTLDEMQKDMDRTETDILNNRITQQTLQRQQEILNRMLEYDKAQRTQDEDNKRESHTVQDITHAVPPSIEDYLRKKQAENELYKTVPPALQPFYKNLVEDYYKKIAK